MKADRFPLSADPCHLLSDYRAAAVDRERSLVVLIIRRTRMVAMTAILPSQPSLALAFSKSAWLPVTGESDE